jgi:hypothetical protein
MRKCARQRRLEEEFREELFGLINQYLGLPGDATLGAIVRTLVNFQQASAVIEAHASTLVMRTRSVESRRAHNPGTRLEHATIDNSRNCAALMENDIL